MQVNPNYTAAALKRIISLQNHIVSNDLGPDSVMQVVVTRIPELLKDATGAAFGLVAEDAIVWQAASGAASDVVGRKYLLRGTLSGAAAKSKTLQCSINTENDGRVTIDASVRLEIGAMVSCPIIWDDATIGVLDVVFPAPRHFKSWELEILSLAASVIAASMRQAHILEQARDESLRDHLTGLGNRRSYDRTLPLLVTRAQHRGEALSLVFLDLDELKLLNDELGHDAGDDLIRRFSQALKDSTRSTDHAFRYGGDEFAVAMTNCDMKHAKRFLSRLGDAVTLVPPQIRFSSGVAHLQAGDTARTLALRADAAMYERKRLRRTALRGELDAVRYPIRHTDEREV